MLVKRIKKMMLFFVLALMFSFSIQAQHSDVGWLDSTIRSIVTNIDEMNHLKISGFIQMQYMNAQTDGMKSIAGTFPAGTHNIFKIRRGRLKVNYKSGDINYVVQLNGTESTFQLLDAYIEFKEPWLKIFTLRGGIFKPTMDQELLYSSDQRYCNEAARIIQNFFPTEYDCGAQLAIKPPQLPISLTLGILNGTTIASENDNRKNFTARLLYDDTFLKGKFRVLAGAATYQGGVYQATSEVYAMSGNVFWLNNNILNQGKQGKRNYYVGELTLQYKSPIGRTWLNAEYWMGDQTASANSVSSPGSTRPTGASFVRPFQSIFGLFAHEIQGTNTALAVKYDYFDPNTAVSGNEIGIENSNTGSADIAYTTLSCGIIFTPTNHLRFSLWYNIPNNEKTYLLPAYIEDQKDNLLTLRMQVRF
jgi:hypothetical protein